MKGRMSACGGVRKVTLRKWFYWFWTTLLLGMAAGGAAGLIILAAFPEFSLLENMRPGFNALNLVFLLVGGALISIFSQMGFFAYLIMRYLMLGIFRSNRLWEWVQIFLIIVIGVDAVTLRWMTFGGVESRIYTVLLPLAVFAVSLAVSYVKVKQTNGRAFIPTLFFVFAVSILEAVPALRVSSIPSQLLMLSGLLACNAWQILLLHKLAPKKEDVPAQ